MVCTANICRSPAAAALFRRSLAPMLPEALIASAGTEAVPGMAPCDRAGDLVAGYVARSPQLGAVTTAGHVSRRVTLADLRTADLVLGLDRSHRSALARLDPRGRPRTFTLRQAAAAAQHVAAALSQGVLPEGAPPMPATAAQRFAWWVGELDASRAFAIEESTTAGSLRIDSQDVPDPHVVGHQYHDIAIELIEQSVERLAASLSAVLDFGGR